jgi:phage tail sheath gpL-like
MVTSIPLVGLAANDPVPGNYIAVNFAQGPASSGTTNYSAILIGNKITTGSATVDTVVYGPDTPNQLASEEDAVSLFGRGSELHLMWKAFIKVNPVTSLYAIAVTESAGAAATGTIGIVGTSVTTSGTIRTTIGTTVVETGVVVGDLNAAVCTAVAASINAVTDLPVTASATTNAVTLTAKNKGLRGNFIRHNAQVFPASGIGLTITPTARTAFTGGTTADSSTTALATIANSRFYYQVSAAEDATQFGALVAQTDANAAPTVGLRCRAFAGSIATLANTITIATGRNSARAEVIWQENSDLTPALLAANAAAIYSLFETALGAQSSLNYDGFGNDAVTSQYWHIPAPLSGATVSRTSIKSALLNGITPVGVVRPGATALTKRVTSRSLNGATADYRIRDAHKVTICDFYADDLLVKANLELGGKAIGDDVAPGQRLPGAAVVTPKTFKNLIFKLLTEYSNKDLLQKIDEIKASVQVVREVSPSTRLSARIPLQPIDILDQTATNVDQVA